MTFCNVMSEKFRVWALFHLILFSHRPQSNEWDGGLTSKMTTRLCTRGSWSLSGMMKMIFKLVECAFTKTACDAEAESSSQFEECGTLTALKSSPKESHGCNWQWWFYPPVNVVVLFFFNIFFLGFCSANGCVSQKDHQSHQLCWKYSSILCCWWHSFKVISTVPHVRKNNGILLMLVILLLLIGPKRPECILLLKNKQLSSNINVPWVSLATHLELIYNKCSINTLSPATLSSLMCNCPALAKVSMCHGLA